MKRAGQSTRRAELVELMRRPAPAGYQLAPQNRVQRRALKRAEATARRNAVKGPK